MVSVDEVWTWVYPSIQELKAASPDLEWGVRRAEFLTALGVYQASDDPLLDELVRRLDELSPGDRDQLVTSDQLDTLVYELAQRLYPPATAEEEAAGAGGQPWSWVSAEQAATLESVWGADWQSSLSADLAARWGEDWDTHPDEHKTAWLSDLITVGVFTPARRQEEQTPSASTPGRRAEPAPEAPSAESVKAAEAFADEFADLAAELPGFDKLSSEDIAQVIAEVLQKLEK